MNHKASADLPTPGLAASTETVPSFRPPPRSSSRELNPVGNALDPPSLVAKKSASALFTATPHETACLRDARAVEQEAMKAEATSCGSPSLSESVALSNAARTWVVWRLAMMRSMYLLMSPPPCCLAISMHDALSPHSIATSISLYGAVSVRHASKISLVVSLVKSSAVRCSIARAAERFESSRIMAASTACSASNGFSILCSISRSLSPTVGGCRTYPHCGGFQYCHEV